LKRGKKAARGKAASPPQQLEIRKKLKKKRLKSRRGRG